VELFLNNKIKKMKVSQIGGAGTIFHMEVGGEKNIEESS